MHCTCEVSEKLFELNLEQNFSVKAKFKREKILILKQNFEELCFCSHFETRNTELRPCKPRPYHVLKR